MHVYILNICKKLDLLYYKFNILIVYQNEFLLHFMYFSLFLYIFVYIIECLAEKRSITFKY